MKKNLTELVFILDRSGSMGGLEQDTIGGFNAMLTRQKEQEGEANVTTILFDHEVQLLHDRFPLKAVAPLTEKDYYCLLYTSPSPRDTERSRMPSSA